MFGKAKQKAAVRLSPSALSSQRRHPYVLRAPALVKEAKAAALAKAAEMDEKYKIAEKAAEAKADAKQKAKEFDEKCARNAPDFFFHGAAPCFASGVLTASALAQARGQREEGRGQGQGRR